MTSSMKRILSFWKRIEHCELIAIPNTCCALIINQREAQTQSNSYSPAVPHTRVQASPLEHPFGLRGRRRHHSSVDLHLHRL